MPNKPGWKDDFWTLILAFPLLLAFVPGAQEFVSSGFRVISEGAPGWYVSAVGVAVAWVFGKGIVPPRR